MSDSMLWVLKEKINEGLSLFGVGEWVGGVVLVG